jgi:hypothetical protein
MGNLLVLVSSSFIAVSAFAHGGEKHEDTSSQGHHGSQMTIGRADKKMEIHWLDKLSVQYSSEVAPIFEKKCGNCHGPTTEFPWYYSIPGVKQFIDWDIEDAKNHVDMSHGYPFGGHGTPCGDIEEIKEVLEDGEMPPWFYLLAHKDHELNNTDKIIIRNWLKTADKPCSDGHHGGF